MAHTDQSPLTGRWIAHRRGTYVVYDTLEQAAARAEAGYRAERMSDFDRRDAALAQPLVAVVLAQPVVEVLPF